MTGASLLLSWLMLFPGQAPTPGEVIPLNLRNLRIPVNLPEGRRTELRELLLFASIDQGRTWQQVAVIGPDKDAFNFNAPADGSYWLIVAAVDRQGRQDPDNLQKHGPDMRLAIDTSKPLLRLTQGQRQGEDVVIAWELKEEAPDWNSFRLEYQTKDGASSWTRIPVTAGLTGQARFRPPSPEPLVVRLVLKDQAGNESLTTLDVAGTLTTASFSASPPVAPPPGATPPAAPPPSAGTPLPPPAATPIFPPVAPPAANPVATPVSRSTPPPADKTPEPSALPRGVEVPPVDAGPPMRPVASTETTTSVQGPTVAPSAPAPSRKPLPPLQHVNHTEVTLNYELNKVGPSGIGAVELWWTQNDGQSWELYATDPEVRGAANGRHERTLELPGDGVYGFRLVVRSKAGLGKSPPRLGDLPEIRVEVDTQPPVGQLFPVGPDPQRPGALLLQWSARDRNLTANPVSLEWAERREGPWTPIAVGLSNVGRHSWHLPEQLPVQVYLRMRLRDLAGNEGIAITNEPQLVDLSEPEGKLLTVSGPRRP